MSRSVQEEMLSVLWFILALLLWRYEYSILSILALIKGVECTIFSIGLAIINAASSYKTFKKATAIAKRISKGER